MRSLARFVGAVVGHSVTGLMALLVVLLIMDDRESLGEAARLDQAFAQAPIEPSAAQPPPPERAPATPPAPDESAPPAVFDPALRLVSPSSAAARCDDPRLIGRAIPALADANEPACGAPSPVEVSGVVTPLGVVALAPAAPMRCEPARRLADWTVEAAQPLAVASFGERLIEMTVVDAYNCRRRRSGDAPDPTARLSEHARANAVDIAAFTFESGRIVRVLDGWNGAQSEAAYLRALWDAACGAFSTVLGPESDALHADHFHFDAAERRSAFCR